MGTSRHALACLVLLSACGGGDMTGLQGIYVINTWTENPTACDVEGASVLGGETALYIKEENFLGEKFVNVVPCTDIPDCESMAGDSDTIHLGNWGFQEGSDEGGWTNSWGSAFDDFDDPTQCDGTRHDDVLTAPAAGGIRLDARTSAEVLFPKPSGVTDCFDLEDDAVLAEVEGAACAELEVLTATFDRELP
jgi:hypothetical protein